MVGLFAVAAPFEKQEQAFVPRGFGGLDDFLDARADVIPNLFPYLPGRLSQSPGMFLAKAHLGVGIVIKEGEFRAPTHPHGEAGGQQDADGDLQTLRPCVNPSKRSTGPVKFLDQVSQRTAARNPAVSRPCFGSSRGRPQNALDCCTQIPGKVSLGHGRVRLHRRALLPCDRRVILGDDDDLAFGNLAPDQPGRLQAVHPGHVNVHQDDVGTEHFRLVESFEAIAGLTAYVPTRLSLNEPAKRPAKQFVVVGDEDFDDIIPPGLFRGSHPNLSGDRATGNLCIMQCVIGGSVYRILGITIW